MHPQCTIRAWDITIGTRIGRVIVHDGPILRPRHSGNNTRMWLCRCDCGTVKWIQGSSLASGNTSSCGCLHREMTGRRAMTHGATRGHRPERLYRIWQNMLRRCQTPTNPQYRHYGARGITVYTNWQQYSPFRAWAMAHGYADHLTIERMDNDRGYSPENCTWIEAGAQANNTRRVHRVEAFGECKTIADWARDPRCQVRDAVLRKRIVTHGWAVEEAVTTLPSTRRFWKKPTAAAQ